MPSVRHGKRRYRKVTLGRTHMSRSGRLHRAIGEPPVPPECCWALAVSGCWITPATSWDAAPASSLQSVFRSRRLPIRQSARPLSSGYTGRMEFEWDPGKAAGNLREHKVSFTEAATVAGDFLSTTANDPDHSGGEHRYITIGLSDRGRLLWSPMRNASNGFGSSVHEN
jgi:hypothetical protein